MLDHGGIVGCIAVYIIIGFQRRDTKQLRDKQQDLIEYRLNEVERKTDTLDSKMERIIEVLNDIKIELGKLNERTKLN